jgi:hypothetical protein
VTRGTGNRVPELRTGLVAAAERQAVAEATPAAVPARVATLRARRTIRHARRVPLLAAALAAVLLSAAVALAAGGLIQIGAPVQPLPGQRFTPTTGYGIPIAASVRLLPLSVPDPAGGPPWGMRYLKTTRGLGCVEVGRVVDGRLGVLGRDGSFGDDGRFHELPADVFEPFDCAPLDGRGQAFIALTFHGRPASGGGRFGCLPAGGPEQRTPVCPSADERLISFGLLGPDARSLSYRIGTATHTIPIAAPLGAYLVVQPLSAPRGQTLGWVTPLASPGASPLTAVGYAGGRVCHIPPADRVGGAHPCPLVGWVAPSVAHLTQAMLAVPVRAWVSPLAYGRHLVYRSKPLRARRLHLAFTARAAVSSARSRYLVELSPPRTGSCSRGMHGIRLSPIERDAEVGETVRVGLSLEPACPGRWSGSVIYVESNASGGPEPFAMLRSMLDLGGRVLGRGSRGRPLLVGRFSIVIR